MIKALVRTVVLVVVVLVLAQFVPFVAEHEFAFLAAVVALGLIGVVARIFIALILAGAVALFFSHII